MRKRKQIFNPISGKFDLISIDGSQGDTLGNGIEADPCGLGAVDFQMNRSSNDETAIGNYSACFGSENKAFGPYSMAMGSQNNAYQSNSVAMGKGAKNEFPFSRAIACGKFVDLGDNQHELFVIKGIAPDNNWLNLMDWDEMEAFPDYFVAQYRIMIVGRTAAPTYIGASKHEGYMYVNGSTLTIGDTRTTLYNPSGLFVSKIDATGVQFNIKAKLDTDTHFIASVELLSLKIIT